MPEPSGEPGGSASELLRAAHADAQTIREQSLACIDTSPRIAARVEMALLALQPLEKFVQEYDPPDENEGTCQVLLVRLINFVQAAREMALEGLFQVALANVRDASLTGHLLSFLGEHPDQIEPWRTSEKEDRIRGGRFTPSKILKGLGTDDTLGKMRGEIYGVLSDSATHPTFRSFLLLTSDPEGAKVLAGPFFDAAKLEMVFTAIIHTLVDMLDALPKLFPSRPESFRLFLDEHRAKVEAKTIHIQENFPSPTPEEG